MLTDTGRLGSLDLQRLRGRVHEFGAYYQAHLAQNLRAIGANVVLDQETGAARLTTVPETVRTAFSKRTLDAVAIARRWAAEAGRDWDSLPPEEKIELAKRGSGIGRQSKDAQRDDCSDFAAWKSRQTNWDGDIMACCETAWTPGTTREERTDRAYRAALPFVERVPHLGCD